MSYQTNKEFMLGANEGDSRQAQCLYIIAHDTANSNATGRNEATYMKRNWQNAYTTHIVGDGIVYLIGEPGYVSWGALNANPYAVAQIELQATPDKELFKKNYAVYVELIRDLAKQFGLPLTLDAGGAGTKGVKSHLWVTNNYGGDHTDPYGYLSSMGISKEQFAKDIANGLSNKSNETPKKEETTKNEEEATMVCLYLRPRKGGADYYYFNGIETIYLSKMDQVKALQQIYKANNGKDMPVLNWTKTGEPWYQRLEEVAPIRK